MSQQPWQTWLVPIVATIALAILLSLTVYLKYYYDQQLLPTVSASQTYQQAVKDRNDLSKSVNIAAIAVFLLAVAPVLRRKDADITLDFSNKRLVWTLLCVVIGAAASVFCHLQFLSEIIDDLRLGGTHPRIPSSTDKVPDLFDPAVSFWFTLQKAFLVYGILLYVLCLFWAKPWKRHATTDLNLQNSQPVSASSNTSETTHQTLISVSNQQGEMNEEP